MLVPIHISSFAIDAQTNAPLVICKEDHGARTLSVTTGHFEASAIALETMQVPSERPLTIDLVKAVCTLLGGTLQRAVLFQGEKKEGGVLARLEILAHKNIQALICRPCDALALVQRCDAPLLAEERLFESDESPARGPDGLRRYIRSMSTRQFCSSYLE